MSANPTVQPRPILQILPRNVENRDLKCLICQHTSSLEEFQEVECKLSFQSDAEKENIIANLEDSTVDTLTEFTMNFMHKSPITNLITVNICQSCYHLAKQK